MHCLTATDYLQSKRAERKEDLNWKKESSLYGIMKNLSSLAPVRMKKGREELAKEVQKTSVWTDLLCVR